MCSSAITNECLDDALVLNNVKLETGNISFESCRHWHFADTDVVASTFAPFIAIRLH